MIIATFAKVVNFARAVTNTGAHVINVTVNTGGNVLRRVKNMTAPGEDSPPLDTDFAIVVKVTKSGEYAGIGYADIINQGFAARGEKRIYGRDSAGVSVNEVYLKLDSSVLISNANGDITLGADGSVIMASPGGSLTLDTAGNVTITGELIIGGIPFSTHVHGGVTTGGGSTGVPV